MAETVEKNVVEPPSSYKSKVWEHDFCYSVSASVARHSKKKNHKRNQNILRSASDSLPQYITFHIGKLYLGDVWFQTVGVQT